MAVSLRFIPGSTIRWQERRFVVVDYAGMDAIVAREVGKRGLQRIPANEKLRTSLISEGAERFQWNFAIVTGPFPRFTGVRRTKRR